MPAAGGTALPTAKGGIANTQRAELDLGGELVIWALTLGCKI